ncbi:hypothetical protein KSF_107470 [Reticulibacter mediterranei]|uniref:Tellurium resistance protein TerC n=1 Tax=Reticulibacter mediterranei TaxID=2778369 RepID=A0A8J3IZ99_9CHLR|nr:YjbE family putative metal transport protein [Reticulibacter mediterranei]GHP00700.1 hypothetical protein KSF_107470 [Reticulibacter mediterranei]
MPGWLGPLVGVILVDLVLSGDNALVIGAAASKLSGKRRWVALIVGGGGAIVARIGCTFLATLLLHGPLVKVCGGVLLMIIAVRLLLDRHAEGSTEDEKEKRSARATDQFIPALISIVVADVTMSLDNVVAVGALAGDQWLILVAGLVISILFVLAGSALVANLMTRFPLLLDLASLVLGWTAAQIILDDNLAGSMLKRFPWTGYVLPGVALALILVTDGCLRWHDHNRRAK